MVSSPEDPAEIERRRQEAKAARTWARDAHPFDRSQPTDDAVEVFDDQTESDALLVAFPGAADRLGIPAVDFFESIADWSLRRVYIRKLLPSVGGPHELGRSVAEIAGSLAALSAGRRRTVFMGTSLGGFHALLLGTLVGVDAVVGINPITSIDRVVLDAAEDTRWEPLLEATSPEWVEAFGDIPRLWTRHPAPLAVVHYPYRYREYVGQAEHLAGQPNVELLPHYENSPMDKIHANGALRSTLAGLLWPGVEPPVRQTTSEAANDGIA